MLWSGRWTIDGGSGPAAGIQRAFVPQAGTCFGLLIEVGVFGLHAMAWQLAPCVGGVAAPASGLERE